MRNSTVGKIIALSMMASLIAGFSVVQWNLAYPGGFQLSSSWAQLVLYDSTHGYGPTSLDISGRQQYTYDLDGDGMATWNKETEQYDYHDAPGITVEKNGVYYLKRYGGSWVQTEEAELLDTFTVPYIKDGVPMVHKYNYYAFGIDVTIKTASDDYYVAPPRVDYGWHYEDDTIDVISYLNIAWRPWVPTGVWSDNYTIVGGWAGILEVSSFAHTAGLVDPEATPAENHGHVIQNIISDGASLSMFYPDTADTILPEHWDNSSAIVGIPSSVDVELQATLNPGAWIHTDLAGHTDAISVRNVFVKYSLVAHLVQTFDLKPIELGIQDPLADPDEDNTGYKPVYSPLDDFFAYWQGVVDYWFGGPGSYILIAIVVLIFLALVCIVPRMRGG